MALYDLYGSYQTPLTAQEELQVGQAREAAARLDANPSLTQVPGGYLNHENAFTPHPVTAVHMGIAMSRAEKQFQGFPSMPEDAETPVRFPGIDPLGYYSVIDMKFAQRQARVEAALESRSPQVQEQLHTLLGAAKDRQPVVQVTKKMQEAARRHRTLTRASKLCLDPEGRRLLHTQARNMEADRAVEQYDKYLQGIEYAAGVRKGPVPQEIRQFYEQQLQLPLDLGLVAQAALPSQQPREIHVEFQNLDHKLAQQQFANPHNWGKGADQLDWELVDLEQVSATISPYARATADRALEPLFGAAETSTDGHVNRGDLITVDGKTIREIMFQQYQAADMKETYPTFRQFYNSNFKQMANDLVAAGLMAGKRVEAFVPDSRGRIPEEPVQITKTGYEPSPLKKVTLNAWQRHFAKRGFYREKAAQAAEYQRVVAARERVQTYNINAQFHADAPTNDNIKELFFRDWVRDNGPMPHEVPNGYSVTRSAPTTIAFCALVRKGHSVEDLMNPEKLQAEKQAVGREVIDRLVRGDQKWLAETLTMGGMALVDQIDRMTQSLDVTDVRQMYSPQARPLVLAAKIGFDAFQEMAHCKDEIVVQEEAKIPGSGENAYEAFRSRCYDMGAYVKYVAEGINARQNLLLGDTSNTMGDLGAVACEEYNRRLMAEKLKSNPGKPVSSLVDPQPVALLYTALTMDKTFKSYSAGLEENPAQLDDMRRGLTDGSFQRRLHLDVDMQKVRAKFGVEPAKDAKQARRAQELEQAAAAHPPKLSGPGRR